MGALSFTKMHGLGNDFVVFDARSAPVELSREELRAIAARRTGIGCDQVITIEPSARADAFMRIHNADGGEVEACGNGTRCVAVHLMAERGGNRARIETLAGVLEVEAHEGLVTVDMGRARLEWRDIPLRREIDTLHVDLDVGPAGHPVLSDPVAVNIGNPHVVFFVDDVDGIELGRVGPEAETASLLPERANVSIAQVLSPEALRVRVWERGVGITSACGTAACASLVAAARRGFTGRDGNVELDGGGLHIEWRDDGHVLMTGPVAVSFSGSLDPHVLAGGVA